MNALLQIKNIKKSFPSGFSLEGVNLILEKPTTLCLLGKNGAGKSTLFNLMTGNLEADSGEICYRGHRMRVDHPFLKKQVGYLPQKPSLPKWVTPEEALHYTASLHNLEKQDELVAQSLAYWDCKEYSHQALASCSHGMQKRVGLAIVSLYNPEFLILDEPFSGLDLSHTYSLENYITQRRRDGKVTLLSTHIAPYAARLCEEAYLARGGSLMKIDPWQEASNEERLELMRTYFSPNFAL